MRNKIKQLPLDENFLVGVTKRSFLLGSVAFVVILGLGFSDLVNAPEWSLFLQRLAFGFGAGSIASILSFEILRAAGGHFLSVNQGENQSSKWLSVVYFAALVLKFPLLITYIYFVLTSELFHVVGLLGGLGLPQFVVFLQALGLFITSNEKRKKDSESTTTDRMNRAVPK